MMSPNRSAWTLALFLTVAHAGLACNGEDEADSSSETSGATAEPVGTDTAASGSGATQASADPAPTAAAPTGPSPRETASQVDRDLAVRLALVPPDPLVVADLLTHADIREIFRYEGSLAVSSLEGIEPTDGYNAIRLASDDGGFGFAVQVWQLDAARQLEPRFQRLRDTWISATDDREPVGDGAFYGEFEGIRYYAFAAGEARSMSVISCQTMLCTPNQLRTLADRVYDRL